MTIMQKEIAERSRAIERMGHMMAVGLVDITPENESVFQIGMTALLEVNEKEKAMQEEAFKMHPWLKKAAERSA